MAIDSHMHINKVVLSDKQKYIDDINNNPHLESVVNVGLNIEASREAIAISKTNPKFYSTIGIHPLYIESQDANELYHLASDDKVLAIGEIGLDTSHDNLYEQRKYLLKQTC